MRDANMADTPVSVQWQEYPADLRFIAGLACAAPELTATNDAD